MDDPRFALGFMLGALVCYLLNNHVSDNGLVRKMWHNPCHKHPKTLPQSTGG